MQILEVQEDQKDQYSEFVAAQESGSFLQSWEWGEWQSALGRQVERFKLQGESGETLGIIQLIKMPLPFGRFYLYAPYGPVPAGGGQLKVESFKFQEFLLGLRTKFPEAVFIRIEPKDESLIVQLSAKGGFASGGKSLIKSPNIQPAKTLIIDLAKAEDVLLADMHPKTRYNIKVAQKHGVEIKDEFDISIGHGLFFDEALKLIIETSNRQKFNTFPESYYKKMVDFFTLHNRGALKLHIYKAVYNNRLLAAAIMLDFAGVRTFLFGGSSSANKNVMAPYLLHWQAMLDAKTSGLTSYDFWGIGTSSGEVPGFVRFKLGFGGEEKQYTGAYDIIINRYWYKIYSLLRQANKIVKKIRPA